MTLIPTRPTELEFDRKWYEPSSRLSVEEELAYFWAYGDLYDARTRFEYQYPQIVK